MALVGMKEEQVHHLGTGCTLHGEALEGQPLLAQLGGGQGGQEERFQLGEREKGSPVCVHVCVRVRDIVIVC